MHGIADVMTEVTVAMGQLHKESALAATIVARLALAIFTISVVLCNHCSGVDTRKTDISASISSFYEFLVDISPGTSKTGREFKRATSREALNSNYFAYLKHSRQIILSLYTY